MKSIKTCWAKWSWWLRRSNNMKTIRFSIALGTSTLLMSCLAIAAPIAGQGEYHFGPDTPESFACRGAEERAKSDALRKIHGEKIAVDQHLSCREFSARSAETEVCELNKMIWSHIGGEIRSSRIMRREVKRLEGSSVCSVNLEIDVVTTLSAPDPGFDLKVRLDRTVFRPGETLTLEIDPAQPMYLAIFNWIPYEKGSSAVTLIFPREHDQSDRITAPLKLPRAGYNYTLAVSPAAPQGRVFVDEYLLIVATKEPVKWLRNYELSELQARLAEIPLDRVRYTRRAYQLLMSNSPGL